LWYKGMICVPNIKELKDKIYGMKRDVAEYVALCDTYERVKTEHQRHTRMWPPLQVPEQKWEESHFGFCCGIA
jgi:hypothetical protein